MLSLGSFFFCDAVFALLAIYPAVNRVLATEKMVRKEVKEKYERIVCGRLQEGRTAVSEETSVNDVFSLFKGVVTTVVSEVVGYRVLKGGRKGNAWWTQEIKEAIQDKRAYKKMLQKNVSEQIRERRYEYVLEQKS